MITFFLLEDGICWSEDKFFVFGDSYEDIGNSDFILTIISANFPPYGRDFKDHINIGRFSNGNVISD